jgi:outer membrane protein assembly factor BamB
MKKFKLIRLLLTIGFVLAIVGIVNAQNWTGWRGNNRNGTVTGFAKPTAWPSQLNKVWEMKVGLGDASPVMAKNQIYLHVKIDTTEVVVCFDAAKGKEIWRSNLNHSPNITGPAIGHPGPRSTPFIDKGKLYTLGAGGVVTCIDSKNGKVVWKNDAYT